MSKFSIPLVNDPVPATPKKNYLTLSNLLYIILISPFLLLKSFLIFLIFFLGWIHCSIYIYLFPNNKSLYNNYFFPIFQVFLRSMLFCWGFFKINTKDERLDKSAPAIFVVNHLTIFDFLLLVYSAKASPLGKANVMTNPVISVFARFLDAVPVDRDNKTGRSNAFIILKQRVEEILPSNNKIDLSNSGNSISLVSHKTQNKSIFLNPEMTMGNGKYLLKFATGAFRFKKPVCPIVMNFKGKNEQTVLRADEYNIPSLLDFLTCFKVDCNIHYLPEYCPNEEEKENPRKFANNVRSLMADALGCGVSEFDYADTLIYYKSFCFDKYTNKCFSLFYDGIYRYNDLVEKFENVSMKRIMEIVAEFQRIRKENGGNGFLISEKDVDWKNVEGEDEEEYITRKGDEEGVKLTDYILIKLIK